MTRDRARAANGELAVADDRPLGDAADREDRHLGVVDDRRREQPTELPRARDRERRATELVGRKRPGPGSVGEPPKLCVDLLHRQSVAAADHRDGQSLRRLHGHADVVPIEIDDLAPVEPRVELRKVRERRRARLDDLRDKAVEVDRVEVAFLHPRNGRDLAVRPRHVLGDDAPHAAQGLAPALGGGSSSGGRADVVFGDPPLRPAPDDGGEVDPELLGHLAHERRRAHTIAGLDGHGGRSVCGSGLGRRIAADDDEDRAHRDNLALGDEDARHDTARGRRDLHGRLVRLHLDQRVVLGDLRALCHEPARDLAFGEALAEIRKLELVRHGYGILVKRSASWGRTAWTPRTPLTIWVT